VAGRNLAGGGGLIRGKDEYLFGLCGRTCHMIDKTDGDELRVFTLLDFESQTEVVDIYYSTLRGSDSCFFDRIN
jgi:hypothetical protein